MPSFMENLPAELVCEIFLKNTERDDHNHNRLVTALRSSQVCQVWRAIILARPSLWGRLLHLNYFEKAKESWTQEVIARGNGAALWITGDIVSSTTLLLFESLMKDYWERVQDLDVTDNQTQRPKKMWSVLLRKAPILERLNINYRPSSYPRRTGPVVIRSLFNNVAPRLQEFHVPGNFQFNMNTPCFANIRVFTFPAEYSVPMILSSLKLLPRLTHLRIESHRFIGHPPPPKMGLVKVDLPSLESLQIVRRDYYDVQALLECITPSSRCGLLLTQGVRRLHHIRNPARHIWAYPSNIYDLTLKWVLAYIDKRPPTFLKLNHMGLPARVDGLGSLMISNDSKRWIHPLSTKESVLQVDVVLDASGIAFMQELVVSLGFFSAVNRLDVSGMVVPSALYWVYQSFSSVTELVITWLDSSSDMKTWYIRDDGTPQPREEALFPRLHTIIADISDKLERIVDYLEYRWEVGLPVCVLDVSSQSLSVNAPESEALMRERLGRLNGLIVISETVLG